LKYNVIIAEDNVDAMEILIHFLNDFTSISILETVNNGEELILGVIRHKPDIVIVDINMPKMDGLSAAKECLKINPNLKVIFQTAYSQFAVDAFEVSAIDYIIKPLRKEKIFKALDTAIQIIKMEGQKLVQPVNQRLYVKDGKNKLYIPFDRILFLEKFKSKVLVHSLDGLFETSESLEQLGTYLDNNAFVKSHRSFIINILNLNYIESTGNTFLAHFHGYESSTAYISKHKVNEIHKRLISYPKMDQ
jgi:two-component system, LytTR family, response regulator